MNQFCQLCEARPCTCGRVWLVGMFEDGIQREKVRLFSRLHETAARYCHTIVDYEDGRIFEYLGQDLLYCIGPFMPGNGQLAFETFVSNLESRATEL